MYRVASCILFHTFRVCSYNIVLMGIPRLIHVTNQFQFLSVSFEWEIRTGDFFCCGFQIHNVKKKVASRPHRKICCLNIHLDFLRFLWGCLIPGHSNVTLQPPIKNGGLAPPNYFILNLVSWCLRADIISPAVILNAKQSALKRLSKKKIIIILVCMPESLFISL